MSGTIHKRMSTIDGAMCYARLAMGTYREVRVSIEEIPGDRERMDCYLVTVAPVGDSVQKQKKGVADDRLPTPVEKTLKELGITPNKESFGACLRPVNCSHDKEDLTPPIGGFHD